MIDPVARFAALAPVIAFAAFAAGCPEPQRVPPTQTPEPVVEPVPASLTCALTEPFPRIGGGLYVTRTIRCTVEGDPGQALSGIALDVDAPFERSTAAVPPAQAVAGDTFDIAVRFRPSEAGLFDHSAAVRFTRASPSDGAPSEDSAAVELSASAYGWDAAPPNPSCRADGPAPLLDRALQVAGLDRSRFTFTTADLAESTYETGGYLNDPFVLSWFKPVRAEPARVGCVEGERVRPLDHFLASPRAAAGMIRHAAVLLDRPGAADAAPYLFGDAEQPWAEALKAFCAGPAGPCDVLEGTVPPDLAQALIPILRAVEEGVRVRQVRDAQVSGQPPEFWRRSGGNLLLFLNPQPDLVNADQRAYLLGEDRGALYAASAQLAFAVQDVEWSRFAGRTGIDFSLRTAAGWVRIRDGGIHEYADDGESWLLQLDLGGDDVYRHPGASNRSAENAVSVVIDLAGNDHYTYDPIVTPHDHESLLAADSGGRFEGNAQFGPLSLSQTYRQGAAQNGIALHFDLGNGDDRYESLRASQGYAHHGVGVLFDEGGNDTYLSEALSQGAGQFGIGLLIDAGQGQDERRAFTTSQGFGYVGGVGFLVDGGGNDQYVCNHGDPAHGGLRLYYSPQMPNDGNNSFCQGAGFGRRGTSVSNHLSGGLGILRDVAGDDRYEASVFAQGTGFWQATGILSDGGGADTYDAYYYAQGGAAHYAVGVLADSGTGNDRFNTTRPARYVTLGTGHDYSVGAFIKEGGDDEYRIPPLSAGASNCNGIGLFVDNAGKDLYVAASDYGSGMGNVSNECQGTRPTAVNIGLMIDGAGSDTYQYPQSDFTLPAEGGEWGHARQGLASEHGGGVDADGETGVHAESSG